MAKYSAPTFLIKFATGRNVFLFALLFVAFSGFIMPSMEADIKTLSGGVGVIDLLFFYTPAKVLSMLNAYGPEGIHLYLIAQWTVDLVFPMIGGMLFITGLIWVGAKRWWGLGLALTLADWIENICITIILVKFPAFSPNLVFLSCFFTMLKWSIVFCSNGMILFYGGKKLLVRFSGSKLLKVKI